MPNPSRIITKTTQQATTRRVSSVIVNSIILIPPQVQITHPTQSICPCRGGSDTISGRMKFHMFSHTLLFISDISITC